LRLDLLRNLSTLRCLRSHRRKPAVAAEVKVEVEEVGEGEGEEVGLPRKTLQKMLQMETPTQVFTKSGASPLLPAVESTPSTNGCTLLMAPTMAHPWARHTPSTLMACTHA